MRKVLVCALLGGALLATTSSSEPAAPAPAPVQIELLEVPPPALEGLEEAVRAQLENGPKALAGSGPSRDAGELAERFGELGHLYHAYEQWPSAAAAYENARRLAPGEPMWSYALAVVAYKRGELEAARPLFAALVEQAPDFVPARYYLAEIALQAGRAAEARALVEQVARQTLSPFALATLGRAAMADGKAAEAAEAYRAALEQVPEANRLHYLLGMALRAQGDLQGAGEQLAKAGTVGVKLPDPLDVLLAGHRGGYRIPLVEGDTALRAGRPADALAAYQRALAAKKDDAELLGRIAVAQVELGDLAAAETALRRAVELAPADVAARMNLARLLEHRGDREGAAKEAKATLEIDPRNAAAHRLLGLGLAAAGQGEAALGHLLPALEAASADEEARFRAAVILVDLGRFAEARDLLGKGLELDPGAVRLSRALTRLLAAGPDLALRDGARAVTLAERLYAATSQPGDLELLAQAQAESGRCAEAALGYRLLAAEEKDAARRAKFAELGDRLAKTSPCRP